MNYLPDTNAMIALLRGNTAMVRRVRNAGVGAIAFSSIVLHELCFGACKGNRTGDLEVIASIRFPRIEFGAGDAMRAGEIRALLQSRGTPIGPYDLLIAGQALARGLTLVTRNLREFERVEGAAGGKLASLSPSFV